MLRQKTAFRDRSLKRKLSYVTQLTTGVALTVVFVAIITIELISSWHSMLGQMSVTLNMVASNVRAAMVFDDQSFAENALKVLKLQPDIRVAVLYRTDDSIFTSYQRSEQTATDLPPPRIEGEYQFAQGLLTMVQPITLEGELVGSLGISSDLKSYFGKIGWFALITTIVVILSFVVVYPLWARLQQIISDPIHSLLGTMKRVSDTNNYSFRATHYGEDELGQLINGFNLMLQQIQSRDQELESHGKNLEREVESRTLDLLQAKEAAENANRTKSEFLANVSHEVRTPMNALLGLTDLVLKTELNTKQKDYLDKIHSSGYSLLEIINDILDISKIEAGGMQLECIDFKLSEVLENLAATTSINANKKKLLLTIDSDPSIPLRLRGDPLRLGQILLNLTNNALKFTTIGEIKVRADLVEEREEQATLRFSIQDSGIGVEADKIPGLFKPFTQADGSHSRLYGGTGLGLAISKHLVELMGGKIGIQSTVGQGSTFQFTVTLKKPSEQTHKTKALPDATPAIVSTVDNGASTAAQAIPQGRVLLVEDNLINQQIAQEMLEGAGLYVRVAADGMQALDVLQYEQFDVVLMDIQMPRMDGYETTRHLRSNPQTRHLPIIAMTAHNMQGDREKCLAAGMDDYIAKPVTSAALFKSLIQWLTVDENLSVAVEDNQAVSLQESVLPDVLPGIDLENGLHIMKGNHQLYRKLLKDFYLEYKDSNMQLARALEHNDLETATQLIHALKGVSGNLAAMDIYQACQVLEVALDSEQLSPLIIERFQHAVEEVITGMEETESGLFS